MIKSFSDNDATLLCQTISRSMDIPNVDDIVKSWLLYLNTNASTLYLIFDDQNNIIVSVRIEESEHVYYGWLMCYKRFGESDRERIMHDFEKFFKTTSRYQVSSKVIWWNRW